MKLYMKLYKHFVVYYYNIPAAPVSLPLDVSNSASALNGNRIVSANICSMYTHVYIESYIWRYIQMRMCKLYLQRLSPSCRLYQRPRAEQEGTRIGK